MEGDFVFVDELVPGVRWDAKYATWDNFTGRPVDGYLANRIVGTKALCTALEKARGKAESLSGWLRKFVRGQFSGSWPMLARWTVQAVSRASCGVPVGCPVSRTASS